jgi:hypothetical protein
VGIVLHADTLFGDGPAALDPGQHRRTGAAGVSEPVDPHTARELATGDLAAGATAAVHLVDRHGQLLRLVRLPGPPAGGWTRDRLQAQVRARLPALPALRVDGYAPSLPIRQHVMARNPYCTGFDCPRPAHRCDLDHGVSYPRGPTDADNLQPRCRADHEAKTRGLVHTSLSPDGTVEIVLPSGLTVRTRPEPLPGHGPGEAYSVDPISPDMPAEDRGVA